MNKSEQIRPILHSKVSIAGENIGDGKIELLRQIEKLGSISAAAKNCDMGYRRAWFLLDSLQNCFNSPLLITDRGGKNAGGTRLTPLAKELIERCEQHEHAIGEASAEFLEWLEEKASTND